MVRLVKRAAVWLGAVTCAINCDEWSSCLVRRCATARNVRGHAVVRRRLYSYIRMRQAHLTSDPAATKADVLVEARSVNDLARKDQRWTLACGHPARQTGGRKDWGLDGGARDDMGIGSIVVNMRAHGG